MNNIPSVMVKKIGSNQHISLSYDFWLDRFVNKGIAHYYDIVTYPDLVELIIFDDKRIEIRRKHELIANAVNLSKDNPSKYDFKRIDIGALKKEHINKSIEISNTKPIKRFLKQLIYGLSFLLLTPLFSKKARRLIKATIDININIITSILMLIGVVLAIIQIIISCN